MSYYALTDDLPLLQVGMKAFATSRLLRAGFPALDGFVLVCPASPRDIQEVWEKMHHLSPLAVRSSMPGEDGSDLSLAGKFETKLDCLSFDDFKEQVEKHDHGALVIQPLLKSDVSGVLFTTDESDSHCMIESTYGLGELLVSGSVTPDRFTVSHRTREITTHLSKNKYYGLFFEPDLSIGENFKVAAHQARMVSHAGELILASFPYTMRISSTLTTAQIHELYACALSLADFFGKPQDVEWCYVNNKLTLLQSRPITIAVPTMVQSSTLGTLSGTCVSKGSAIGRAFHITDTSNFTLPTEEFILVAHETKPDMIYQMSRASGIVTEVGGMLCHAAIVARELGIPCLVGVDDALSLLREGSLIQLNEEGVRLL